MVLKRHGNALLAVAGLLMALALWEALSRSGVLNPRFFPPPTQVLDALVQLTASGRLPGDVAVTALRVVEGFLAGAAPALVLGLLMGFFPGVRALLLPLATAIYTVPKIAIYPLVIVVLGLGEGSKVAIVAISVFFLVLLNTMAGVATIERALWDAGRAFGASWLQMLWTVALPGALPVAFAGLKLAMGFGLVVIVGAEFLGASSGVGSLIWLSYQTFRLEQMYAGLVMVAALGLLFHGALELLEKRLLPWRV